VGATKSLRSPSPGAEAGAGSGAGMQREN
jgi:hypothetical protein